MVRLRAAEQRPIREIFIYDRIREFRTALTDPDLLKLPGMAFPGTIASELRFFDINERFFSGHAVVIQPGSICGLQPLFHGTMNSLEMSIQTARNLSYKGFKKTGLERLDASDYPVMLIATGAVCPYLYAKKEDLLAALIPSQKEMESIVAKVKQYTCASSDWKTNREYAFSEGVVELLVQGILDTLEGLIKR